MKIRIPSAAIGSLLVALSAPAQELTDEQVTLFNEDALPVLQDNCFKCHGGGDKIESDLNLTSRAGLLLGGVRGPALNLDSPADSRLLKMIAWADEEHQMPPKRPLVSFDRDALTEWILDGAPWPGQMNIDPADLEPEFQVDLSDPDLWGFRPVAEVQSPTVADPAWNANPIDRFIAAKLRDHDLKPNPLADKRVLIRRAYYDLIGLPPTPEEVETFANDDSPDAWERLIDKLLDSPQYGEKWGRHWLDLVRYADSHGYERDSNKPFIWRYRDYVIRAFNEDKPYDRFIVEQLAGDEIDEPTPDSITATGYYRLGLWDDEPADPLLGRYDNLDDIVDTTSRVFLGMTMGCARCHSHKLDPFPQEDYYRFLSFFENITELKRGREGRDSLLPVANADEQAELDRALDAWEANELPLRRTLREHTLNFAAIAGRTNPEALEGTGPERTYLKDLRYSTDDGHVWQRLDHDFISLWPAHDSDRVAMKFDATFDPPADGEFTLHIETNGMFEVRFNDEILVSTSASEPRTIETTFAASEPGPMEIQYEGHDALTGLRIEITGPGIEGRRFLSFPNETREDIRRLTQLAGKNGKAVLGDDRHKAWREAMKAWEDVRNARPEGPRALAVMEKGTEAPESHVLLRGNPHVKGRQVTPGFPAIFGSVDAPAPSPYQTEDTLGRRRQAAEWIASPENPMTARVHANRLWQYHFGRGIVRSSGNFGAVSMKPTHPQLLDWLTAEFIRKGWRQKPMHKLIMMSRAYRMSSAGQPEALQRDPANNLFWRYDIRRLTSEELRDAILAVSGNLNLAMFGPGIYPELAPEVVATSSKKDVLVSSGMWGESSPEEQARRSIYIHTKRSLRLSLLTDFDSADTDATCPVRFATTQPTQALGLLNSKFTQDQAAIFANRLREESGSLHDQVRRGFQLALTRPVTHAEIDRGLQMIDELQRFNGLSPEKALDRFCLLLLNLNEFLFID